MSDLECNEGEGWQKGGPAGLVGINPIPHKMVPHKKTLHQIKYEDNETGQSCSIQLLLLLLTGKIATLLNKRELPRRVTIIFGRVLSSQRGQAANGNKALRKGSGHRYDGRECAHFKKIADGMICTWNEDSVAGFKR